MNNLHSVEAGFHLFVGPLLKGYLNRKGLEYEIRNTGEPKAVLELDYDGIVLVEVTNTLSGRVHVVVRPDSPITPLLRIAIRQTRMVLAPIFPELAKYLSDELAEVGLAEATPKQIDVVNLLVLRMRRRGDSTRLCDGVVRAQYGSERYEIKSDGNYIKSS